MWLRGMTITIIVITLLQLFRDSTVNCSRYYDRAIASRAKQARAIRGFKGQQLTVARSFGKRAKEVTDDGDNPNAQRYGIAPPDDPSKKLNPRYPLEWYVEELQNNPNIARHIIQKFIDANDDLRTLDDLFKPRRFY